MFVVLAFTNQKAHNPVRLLLGHCVPFSYLDATAEFGARGGGGG